MSQDICFWFFMYVNLFLNFILNCFFGGTIVMEFVKLSIFYVIYNVYWCLTSSESQGIWYVKYWIKHQYVGFAAASVWILPWWRHQMETFSALLAICAGNSPVNSLHKVQRRGALMFSLIWRHCNAKLVHCRRHLHVTTMYRATKNPLIIYIYIYIHSIWAIYRYDALLNVVNMEIPPFAPYNAYDFKIKWTCKEYLKL